MCGYIIYFMSLYFFSFRCKVVSIFIYQNNDFTIIACFVSRIAFNDRVVFILLDLISSILPVSLFED